jgi:hypothetical protein
LYYGFRENTGPVALDVQLSKLDLLRVLVDIVVGAADEIHRRY